MRRSFFLCSILNCLIGRSGDQTTKSDQRFNSPEPIIALISTSAIWDSVSMVLIKMLSDMFGILLISISKAASLLFATSVAASYLVIRNWSISAFISTDRSLVLSNFSRHFLGLGLLGLKDLWGSGRGHLTGMGTSAYQWPLLEITS